MSEHPEEGIDVDVPLKRQVERPVVPDAVDVPPPSALAVDVASPRQVRDDALRSSLRDVEQRGDLSDSDLWIARDEEQRVAVIREKPKVRDRAQGVGRLLVCHGSHLSNAVHQMA